MNCTRFVFFIALVAIAVRCPQAVGQNLLSNPGFEDPVTAHGYPFVGSWNGFNGDAVSGFGNSTTTPRTGAQDLSLSITNTANSFAGAYQDVPGLVAGQQVTFSGFNMTPSNPLDLTVEVRIEWRSNTLNDASSVEVTRTANLNAIPGFGQYTPFTLTATVPVGATAARAVYAVQSFSGGPTHTGTVFVDDVSFTRVPEPSSILLAGLGGLALLRRRRRS